MLKKIILWVFLVCSSLLAIMVSRSLSITGYHNGLREAYVLILLLLSIVVITIIAIFLFKSYKRTSEPKFIKTITIIGIVIIVLSFITATLFIFKPKWTPFYCSQYSGFQSYAWNGNFDKCNKAGCLAIKTKEVSGAPGMFDGDGYQFKCVGK